MIIVLGSVNMDLFVRGPRLPRAGETVLGGHFYQAHGGKGANQAVAAARAGARVTFVGAVGMDDFGAASRRALEAEGIDCTYLQVCPDASTGVALIMVDDEGENCISVSSGANALVESDSIDALPAELWESGQVFLASLELPWKTVRHALKRAKESGVYTILNPAPVSAEFLADLHLEDVDMLTPNEHEAAALSGIEVNSLETARAFENWLDARGCENSIITRGARGVILQGDTMFDMPAIAVKVVDTTGAGDAFNGAFAARLFENDLHQATRYAVIAAGLAVTREGAQPSLPRHAEIEALL